MEVNSKYAGAEMMIRKPVAEVFNAFIDPHITTKFWFTRSSGRLEEGAMVEWHWEMYGISVPVIVKTILRNSMILVEWGTGSHTSTIEWIFNPLTEDKTYLSIKNYGFNSAGDDLINEIRDSTEGFSLVIAACKAYLEHGVQLNLAADKNPPELNRNA